MSELTKDFIKFIAEAILLLLIFVVLFSDSGIIISTYDFMQYGEPLQVQDSITRAITTATYSPDFFEIKIVLTGKPHELEISTADDTGLYRVRVIPAQASEPKTKYLSIDAFTVLTDCTITEGRKTLGDAVIVRKEIIDDGCEITFHDEIGFGAEQWN